MDYSFVPNAARIALYDDMLSSPQIVEVPPAETADFIGKLAAEVYNHASDMGGSIPFSAIKQVAENFIHADFREIVVSIMDAGNTIRFADQGPGIADKQRAQLPGFSSATEPMKRYIDGVGSGLPIVREYLDVKHGTLTLDDNLNGGSVVTLSLVPAAAGAGSSTPKDSFSNLPPSGNSGIAQQQPTPLPAGTAAGQAAGYPIGLAASSLSARARTILSLFRQQDMLGVQDISTMADIPLSSTHAELRKLEEAGLIEKIGRKRVLSPFGIEVAKAL